MDITQTVLLAVTIVLAVFMVVLGFQIFFVLKDVRKTLFKINNIFDEADDMIGRVKKPVESVTGLLSALATGVGIAHILKKVSKKNERQ